MFHKAIKLEFKEGTVLELSFQNGEVKQYDVAELFSKYPQLTALRNRELFLSGKLAGSYGIIWNDELDLEAETVYEDGITVRREDPPINMIVGNLISEARAKAGLSQKELSVITGMDQADISRIERGAANPSLMTIKRITDALGTKLTVSIL